MGMSGSTPVEIERKFLVDRTQFKAAHPGLAGHAIQQGYWKPERLPFFFGKMVEALADQETPEALQPVQELGPEGLEMRVRQDGDRHLVTFKSRQSLPTGGVWEFEFPLANEVAQSFLEQTDVRLSKIRYEVELGENLVLEVDLFEGLNGLTMAEVEIPSLDTPLPPLPAWVGEEVTGNPVYFNRRLAEDGLPAALKAFKR